jgi:putative ABC transport system permease protein
MLALTGLILTVEAAVFAGMMSNSTHSILESRADLWITKNSRSAISNDYLEEGDGNILWLHPNVVHVQIHGEGGRIRWKTKNGERKRGRLIPLDLSPSSLNFPKNFTEEHRRLLTIPGTVLIPVNYMASFNAVVGQDIELGLGEPNFVQVAGMTDKVLSNDFPIIYASQNTFNYLNGSSPKMTTFLIKLKDPSLADQTAKELQYAVDKLDRMMTVWTPETFIDNAKTAWFDQDENANMMLYSVGFIAFFSLAIASQVMRANLFAQLKEFGTLNALGVSRFRLALVALEQGFWVGICSIGCAMFFFFIIQYAAAYYSYSLVMTWTVFGVCSALILTVSLISGFFSVSILRKIELTSLLR